MNTHVVRFTFFLLAWLTLFNAYAQPDYNFKTGLIVADCHRYGREALFTDQVAYQLYTGKLKRPAEGSLLFTNEKGVELKWQSIQVDSAGKFSGEMLGNAYLYLNYESDRVQQALLNISGNSMVYVNGEPHGGDIYADGWMNIPVRLKRGPNFFLVRCGAFARWQGVSARLTFPSRQVMITTDDATLPHVVIGETSSELLGAVVIINNTSRALTNLVITSTLSGKEVTSKTSDIAPMTMRKVPFTFSPAAVAASGEYTCKITLKQGGKVLDENSVSVSAVDKREHHSYTFTSAIDGSVQYYSVAPPTTDLTKPALFLSVHGAGVQAIGQARAYQPKDWGVLVAPTNRRPRGFNWEDWGRMDALEVFELARQRYNPDPERIYLTGHSMGGHGTWYLGATYPDKWAAIAPCAGYPTLTGYGSADGKIPEQGRTEHEQLLLRSSNASNVLELTRNYNDLGIYIHHGDDDRVVSVNYARQMRKILGDFHSDFSYYEYPGGSHWFGNESVDWKPIFDYFRWHKLAADTASDVISFTTANPGISSAYRWGAIVHQDVPLAYSRFELSRDKNARKVIGTTQNVTTLKLKTDFARVGETVTITLDSVTVNAVVNEKQEVWLGGYPQWKVVPAVTAKSKNPQRAGTFKEAFNHRMVFVYGTRGTPDENTWSYNKARYDAEVWYYRGNGAIDIIADKDFDPVAYRDRGVIIYGNSVTNSAWTKLLRNCPIKVTREAVSLGAEVIQGGDLGAYFVWPREDSDVAMVAVVAGTGLPGMKASDSNQYFAAGSGFPDYLIFSAEMLNVGPKGIRAAGFFDNAWKLPVK